MQSFKIIALQSKHNRCPILVDPQSGQNLGLKSAPYGILLYVTFLLSNASIVGTGVPAHARLRRGGSNAILVLAPHFHKIVLWLCNNVAVQLLDSMSVKQEIR